LGELLPGVSLLGRARVCDLHPFGPSGRAQQKAEASEQGPEDVTSMVLRGQGKCLWADTAAIINDATFEAGRKIHRHSGRAHSSDGSVGAAAGSGAACRVLSGTGADVATGAVAALESALGSAASGALGGAGSARGFAARLSTMVTESREPSSVKFAGAYPSWSAVKRCFTLGSTLTSTTPVPSLRPARKTTAAAGTTLTVTATPVTSFWGVVPASAATAGAGMLATSLVAGAAGDGTGAELRGSGARSGARRSDAGATTPAVTGSPELTRWLHATPATMTAALAINVANIAPPG
jgi:hypothetical protein